MEVELDSTVKPRYVIEFPKGLDYGFISKSYRN